MEQRETQSEKENKWNSIENKWISYWDKNEINNSQPVPGKQKFFITVAYPYPNSPQHIGHGRTYTIADVHARYNKLKGKNVLFPMGFHYTGSPILGMSRRVKDRDVELINNFKNIFELDDNTINSFTDPLKIARYFHNEIRTGMKEMGYFIDWRHEFTTIDDIYKKFISWQFRALKDKGVIEQGSHPVGWCPVDSNPVSQHDTIGDIEPSFTEYSFIKFKLVDENVFIPVATLRPETIYGVSNLWINHNSKYIKVLINNNEKWIISEASSKKLEYLNYTVQKLEEVDGESLIGKFVVTPITKCHVPILPASFVTLEDGSGIVMSVPAHAPFDMQAILDLKNNDKYISIINEYIQIVPKVIITSNFIDSIQQKQINFKINNNISDELIEKENQISDPQIPSMYFLKKYSIINQNDPKLESATAELYSLEFYNGVMNDNAEKFKGMKVSDAKEKIRDILLKSNDLTIFYELTNKPVYCRCGSLCYVKLLNNQWFLNYGNSSWKNLAYECLGQMEIIPPEIILEFKNTFDWLKERACARKSGLGTLLPWDHEWIIESLSDSVVYMIYYLIAKYVNTKDLKKYSNLINDSFFNYILYGKKDDIFININNSDSTTEKDNKIIQNLIKTDEFTKKFLELTIEIRNEIQYYYPVDSRHSGRDLIPNHLSFYIFNHSILFSREKWPKQIVVNGSVLMDGKKMSKSMGNIIPLRKTIRQYSADSIRVAMLSLGELLQDVDFSFTALKGIFSKLNDMYEFNLEFFNDNQKILEHIEDDSILINSTDNLSLEDRWLLHRLNRNITEITKFYEELKIRDALNSCLYLMEKDFDWYKKRKASKNVIFTEKESIFTVYLFLKNRLKMIAPFCPFLSEEIWQKIKLTNNSIFNSSWPSEIKIFDDLIAEENEQIIQDTLYDINKIIRITKNNTPEKLFVYVASKVKKSIYSKVLGIMLEIQNKNFGDIMKSLLKNSSLSDSELQFVKGNASFIKKTVEDILSLSPLQRKQRAKMTTFDEISPLVDSIPLLSAEFNIPKERIKVYAEDDEMRFDPNNKSNFSRPYKPALYLE